MANPGENTKGYETPNHPFQGERISDEHSLVDRYGLSGKEELWRAQSELRSFRREARERLGEARSTEAAQEAAADFVARLKRIDVLDEGDQLDDVLGLDVTDVLERRLQTVVYRKGLANTPQQARQFITHGHIVVGDSVVDRPSYTVEVDETAHVSFDGASPLDDELHPERAEAQE
jgi:small subunit ribosomal protein S4